MVLAYISGIMTLMFFEVNFGFQILESIPFIHFDS